MPGDEAAEVVIVKGDAGVLAGDGELAQLPPGVQPETLLLSHLADISAGVVVHLKKSSIYTGQSSIKYRTRVGQLA